ncbi:MAG: sigma-70 family RNA polymerase sigma factor [Chloroflexi bacterium]|nr:sigma-70 family RNA polymerase sigma factor [Chloroflexota bacterium]
MEETGTSVSISLLIAKATAARAAHAEKGAAFGQIVRQFQDMAFACAYAVLGDFYLAEDAAQEAFIAAWRNLDQLRQPEAFPGWFKRIVLSQCNRMTRGKHLETVPLDAIEELVASDGGGPNEVYEQREQQQRVLASIQALPEHERLVTALYYIGDYSTSEIATFLEVPLTTVKKRLYDARQKLRERMLDMVRETLQEQRPSRNEAFVDTVALFNEALESFVAKVKQDRYIIAAILFGSLSHDTVWKKSDIDIMLVGREEKPGKDFYLVENGVNIHAVLYPRSRFKQMLEGTLQGDCMHSAFALSTLLFTSDDTIRAYYQDVRKIGAHDAQMRLIVAGGSALYTLAKAEKWLYTRQDVAYSFLRVMYTIQNLATIEVLLNGEMTSREVIPQALKINPALFKEIYQDLIHQPKDEAVIQHTLDRINAYIDEKVQVLFGPILEYLAQEGGTRTTTELDTYFKKLTQQATLSHIYEWLAFKGIVQKVPSPVRLHPKSQVTVDEAAYYYDGGK